MSIKSERLKKFETELHDLEQWLKLGLVPKKDIEKHKEEITALHEKINEEKERLRHLKESGELEEFTAPKRPQHGRQAFQEPHSLPDIDLGEEGMSDLGMDMETETYEVETSSADETSEYTDEGSFSEEEEEDEDPFSDRSRWKRGILEDPDANDW
jgi:LPS O-antigen subunit length determinant protein (WzzB/FepE family)